VDTKVDVVVVTKDPNYVLPNELGGIPVHDVIVETSTPLAKARQRAIRRVTTDWFVFVDDDIILPDDWWVLCSQYMWHDVGAIQGTAIPHGLGKQYDKRFADYFDTLPIDRELNGNSRMFTHNTLIRTEAVRDWNPPADLEAYEDYHMMRHMMDNGYKVYIVATKTYHLYCWNKFWRNARWSAKGRLRFRPKSEIIRDFAGTPITFLKHGWCIGMPNFVRASAAMYELIIGGR